jgi:hypothetical protein
MDAIRCSICSKVSIESGEQPGVCLPCANSNNPVPYPIMVDGRYRCQKAGCRGHIHSGEITMHIEPFISEEYDKIDVENAARTIVEVMHSSEGLMCPRCMSKYISVKMNQVGIALISAHQIKRKRDKFEDDWA